MARILVADDHADSREVLGVILARGGHDAKLVAISAGWNRPEAAATGIGTFDVLHDASVVGADAPLAKSITYAALLAVVDRVLGTRADG